MLRIMGNRRALALPWLKRELLEQLRRTAGAEKQYLPA